MSSFFAVGGIGAWKIQSHTKVRAHNEEIDGKYKNKKGLNIDNFRYGYMAQIGYNKFGVYLKYYPDSIFKNGRGPSVRQINIGIIITNFSPL